MLARSIWICELADMSLKPVFPILLFAIAPALPLPAQTQQGGQDQQEQPQGTEDRQVKNRFWQASVKDGHYMVALDRITSVSRQKYLLDGSIVVDEVTVDTLGETVARFYFISPLTDEAGGSAAADTASRVVDRARGLVDRNAARAGLDVQNMVVKKYPETTHAKTIEYRVMSEAQLSALYRSVRTAWEKNRGREFVVR